MRGKEGRGRCDKVGSSGGDSSRGRCDHLPAGVATTTAAAAAGAGGGSCPLSACCRSLKREEGR